MNHRAPDSTPDGVEAFDKVPPSASSSYDVGVAAVPAAGATIADLPDELMVSVL